MRKNKGITLIALIITIIILLILSSVAIYNMIGEEGIISAADSVAVTTSHSNVKEKIRQKLSEHKLGQYFNNKTDNFIDYLKSEDGGAVITTDGTVNIDNILKGNRIGSGTGTSNVYKIEKVSEEKYKLNYYDKDSNVHEIDVIIISGKTPTEANTDAKYFKFTLDKDTLTATLDSLNPDYASKYYYNYMAVFAIVDGEKTITDIVIPSQIVDGNDTYRVTAIADYAFCGYAPGSGMTSQFTSIQIPEGIESIGNNAFKYCEQLTEIKLPSTLKNIGEYAFEACIGITSVVIPNEVTVIQQRAFEDCTKLQSVTLPPKLTSLEYGVFMGCENLANIELPNTLKYLGGSAFYGCSNLKSITVPSGVTTIEQWTFSACTSLQTLKLSEGLKEIKKESIEECTSLAKITIPSSVETIGNSVFYTYSSTTPTLHIYTDLASKPAGWSSSWTSGRTVSIHWGEKE